MLVEEKQRKVFNNQLPKLEEDLAHFADEYAQTNDRKEFTINGLFWSEYIQRRKQDHEESKMNERKEKQIMRDNLKRNESRYGSKPITPLAIRNKRKLLTTHHETQLATPSRMRNSKIIKTDATPGTVKANVTSKPARTTAQPKLGLGVKRKSKTPAKNRFRKSRGLNFDVTANETVKDTTKSSMANSYQTINSTTGSNSSRLGQSRVTRAATTATRTTKQVKPPPQSSSAKYASKFSAASKRIGTFEVMQSTASNTFLEEENLENLENDETVLSQNKMKQQAAQKASLLTQAAARKITSFASNSSKFSYKHPESSKYEKFSSQEIDYHQFTVSKLR